VAPLGEADPLPEPEARVEDLFEVWGQGEARRARTHEISSPSVFGGQLFGLAVVAATDSAGPEFGPVSMHAQLLDRGVAGTDIDMLVTNVRDGRSSRHRSVTQLQGGRPIASIQLALGLPSDDDVRFPREFEQLMPPLPSDHLSPFVTRWGFDQLDVVHVDTERAHPMWVKPRVALTDDLTMHAAALAFISDMGLVLAAREAGDDLATPPLTVDHAIWFHGSPRFDGWVLLDAKLSARHGDHGLVAATLTDVQGNLLATIAQGVRFKRSGPKRRA
jgi:acyl-CoA thioesterase-2